MKIFMLISFACFSFMWSLFFMKYICTFSEHELLNLTTFGILDEWLSLEYLVLMAEFANTFFYQIVLVLNTCLCLDLIMTLRDPFKSPEARYNLFCLVSVVFSFPAAFIRAKAYNIYIYGWIVVSVFFVYILCAIVSAIYAICRLRQAGISSEARQMFARRHISYIVVNFVCQSYNIYSKYVTNTSNINVQNALSFVMTVLFFGQGIFLNLVRLAEPSLMPTLKYHLTETFCGSKKFEGEEEA